MDATSLGMTVFNSLPAWTKGVAIFTREVVTVYNQITGAMVSTTETASAPVVSMSARGTSSESFAEGLQIREKYLILIVPAQPLGDFRPQAGDTVQVGANKYRVFGIDPTEPNGADAAIYRVVVER